MLGFLCNLPGKGGYASRFVPASPACPPHADLERWRRHALDSRHDRVLLHAAGPSPHLNVWDPVTGERWELPPPLGVWNWWPGDWNAAVLCAASGGACDHLHCRGAPFLVVFVGDDAWQISLFTYSPEAGSWSEPIFAAPASEYGVYSAPTALVGNSLYFNIGMGFSMLRYDLITRETSFIDHIPVKSIIHDRTEPMTMEDDGILVAVFNNYERLLLWSMEENPNGDAVWPQIRVIELKKLLPADAFPVYPNCFAFVRGVGIVVGTKNGLFVIDLKSDKVEMVCEGKIFQGVVPYMSFYIPGTTFLGL